MDRPDIETIRSLAATRTPVTTNRELINLCDYILHLEAKDGWTHKGACAFFKECCDLMMWDDPPYSWFSRVCRNYGYDIPISVFRRFTASGKTVFDLDKKGSPLPYFAAICENIYQEQKAVKDSGEPPPPYYKEYESGV